MPTTTTTYSFNKPVVGADEDSWGGYLNGNWDSVDDLLDGTTAVTGIDINSGSIDGTPIGAASASTGNFSTLSIGGTAITATAAELNKLDGMVATTVELNYLIGTTSEIQAQINSKANLSGASFTGAVDVDAALTANSFALDNGASDWTFEVSGNNLIIKYAGVSKMKLDTSGNLTVTGNVTAYGTV